MLILLKLNNGITLKAYHNCKHTNYLIHFAQNGNNQKIVVKKINIISQTTVHF